MNIADIIDGAARNRVLVLIGALALLAAGLHAVRQTPLDAIPDLSDTQVIIRTEWEGQAPQIIEDQITYPLTTQMLGLPKTKVVRGFSMFGDSFVYIVFQDGVDQYWARSRVLEALSQARMPDGVSPRLGPDATGVGWVFQYALYDRSGKHDLQQLRSLQDWFIRYELASVPGVAEVASIGGFVKEYQILVDPNRLRAYGIGLDQVIGAVRGVSRESGGRTLEMAEREYLVRTFGYAGKTADLEQAVLKSENGRPVTVADVGRVVEAPALRRGIAELDGEGEAIGGIVIMRPGENALTVIDAVKARLETVRQGLPQGVELKIVYDRSALIERAVDFLWHKLLEESLMVALVMVLFLLHVRSALVVILTLPLSILAAFIVMNAQGITANIMSLGGIAIAIGTMVDAAIVMVENAHRKLSQIHSNEEDRRRRVDIIIGAARDVGPGLFFSLLIITVSFLPVFALTGQSAKLFAPLAFTKSYAMAAAAILSVTLVPVLMLLLMRGRMRPETENPVSRFFAALYRPVLEIALRAPRLTLLAALVALVSTVLPFSRTGAEFMPPLYEGGLLYMPMTLPDVSPAKAREILQVTNRQIMSVPEVAFAFGKAGRADTATDPAPLSMIETWIELKPRDAWRPGMTPEKLMAELDKVTGLPGLIDSWGYPVKIRLDMLTTGIRTPVGIKISGPDLGTIAAVGENVETAARSVRGTRSAIADRVTGGSYLEIHPDRPNMARYGVSMEMLHMVIQSALGGMTLAEAVEGRERYGIMVRYDRPFRAYKDDLDNILVPSEGGAQIPLADLAAIEINHGPSMIISEDARLNGWVFVDIADRDLGGYIADLRQALDALSLPPGVSLKLSGQFEQMQQANERLAIAIPAALLLIVLLLYLHFGRWDRTLLILLAVPFGVMGGVWSVWLAGYHFSAAVAIGFIALAGLAVETGIVMLLYIDQQMRDHPPVDRAGLIDNIRHGALLRLRPKLMTVLTIILGLIPIFLSDGTGDEVMRRIALPMVGGMVSTTILTLVIIPAVYLLWQQRGLARS